MRQSIGIIGLAVCACLPGCTKYLANQISPQSATYNSAVSNAASQQLLDNIVSVYNHEMPSFMDISYVTIGNNYSSPSLTLDQSYLNYPGNLFSAMGADLTLAPTYWSPTVGLTPSTGSQLIKPLFAPFSLYSMTQLMYSHTDINMMLHLLVKRISPVGSMEVISLDKYDGSTLTVSQQRNVNDLFALVQKIYKANGLEFDLIDAEKLTEGVEVSFGNLVTETVQSSPKAGGGRKVSVTQTPAKPKEKVKGIALKPMRFQRPYVLIFPIPKGMTYTATDKKALAAFNIPLNVDRIAFKTPFYSATNISAITISTRSLYAIMVFLSDHIDGTKDKLFPGEPIIYKTRDLPEDSRLETFHNGYWYSIKEGDTSTIYALEMLKLLYSFSIAQSSFANLSSSGAVAASDIVESGEDHF